MMVGRRGVTPTGTAGRWIGTQVWKRGRRREGRGGKSLVDVWESAAARTLVVAAAAAV
jgi:hypothetical protein